MKTILVLVLAMVGIGLVGCSGDPPVQEPPKGVETKTAEEAATETGRTRTRGEEGGGGRSRG